MGNLLMILVLISPILWIASIFLLKDWEHFWKFFIVNAIILAFYLIITMHPAIIDLGHDEYGLKRFVTIGAVVFTHLILGLIFAVGYRLKKVK